MNEKLIDKAISTYRLQVPINEISAEVGDSILELMNIYKRHIEGPTEGFVLNALTYIIKDHETTSEFLYDNEINNDLKDALIPIMLSKIYENGKNWLVKEGFATPTR